MKLEYAVNVGGTETFRFTMSKSPFRRGCNAQTLPKALRYYLQPPKGRVFVQGDLSQAEARVVAYLSRCKDLIDLFNDHTRHVHHENALVVFGHAVEKDSPEYTLAKAVVHASHYREGPYKFSVQTGIPVKQTKELLARYHAKRPEIHQWHKKVWDTIKTTGRLETCFGDRRMFYEAISCFSLTGKMTDQHWKDAISWVPQTTIPHLTNLGLIAMATEQKQFDIWFHHQGHDSFLVSLPIGKVVEFIAWSQLCYKIALFYNMPFSIPMEYSVGYNFGDMMAYDGHEPSQMEWQAWLDEKLAKKPREQRILDGVYGVHLKDFRV